MDGEKNFWRKKLKRRNQSVSVTEVADQSGIVVHDDDQYHFGQDNHEISIDVSLDKSNIYTDFVVTPAQ